MVQRTSSPAMRTIGRTLRRSASIIEAEDRAAEALATSLMRDFLSDRSKSRFGKRKPWVLAGALICAVSIFFLFRPPAQATILYYALWSFLLYFGFTLFEIPRNAWGAEINREYIQRSRINTYV